MIAFLHTDAAITCAIWGIAIGLAVGCFVAWCRAGADQVRVGLDLALAVEAADHGEPSRAEVESGWLSEADETWLFPDPAVRDLARLDDEADMVFAASVLADIDDLPTTGCGHRLDGGPLRCTRADAHDPDALGGHIYSASWAADRHDTTEARDD